MTNHLIQLRKELHRAPELSGNEKSTASLIVRELKKCNPDEILEEVGGTGVAAVFRANKEKAEKAILFRAELDAIAVQEETRLPYQSKYNGIMHGCGHDGHMAILVGLGYYLKENPPKSKDVVLLFQPAEETGEGAERVLADKRFQKKEIEQAFALHNLPGFEERLVILRQGVFASASTGIEIGFKGKSSHAAYPEKGINPSRAMVDFIRKADIALEEFRSGHELNKAVNTYIRLGEPAFGITPGTGRVGFTLRSPDDKRLDAAVSSLRNLAYKSGQDSELEVDSRIVEPFAATINSEEGVYRVFQAAKSIGLRVEKPKAPFPWSEDFGEFGKNCPITLFGLGAGTGHPHLHSEAYDFNDELIEPGIAIFAGIIEQYVTNYRKS
jgi:amidohydrolase